MHNIKSSILAKTNDVFIGSGVGDTGTILDFTNATLTGLNDTTFGFYGYGGSTGQHDVTVKSLVIQNCKGSSGNCIGLKQGSNWKVENVEIRENSMGFTGNCANCYVHHNKTYGVTSPGIITNSEISFNGGIPDPGTSTGGSKAVQLVNSTWTGNYIHDNEGPGIWCDGCWQGSTFIIQNNRIENNKDGGIVFEITWGAPYSNIVVNGNQLKGNSYDYIGKSCFWAGQITVQNSSGISIVNNAIDSSNGANALCVIDTVRSDSLPKYPEVVTPFTATNNTFILAGSALVGEQGNNNGSYTVNSSNITFDNNVYEVDSLSYSRWQLNSGSMSWSQWQNSGEDKNSKIILKGSGTTPILTLTPTSVITIIPTKIPTLIPTNTPIPIPTLTSIPTPTNKPTVTPTKIPLTPTHTPVPTLTKTPTVQPTLTSKPNPTLTIAPTQPVFYLTTNIISPTNNSVVSKNSTITIKTSNSTSSTINKVEIYVNGNIQCTIYNAPYECSLNVPNVSGVTYKISSKVYDTSGNSAYSSLITVHSSSSNPFLDFLCRVFKYCR